MRPTKQTPSALLATLATIFLSSPVVGFRRAESKVLLRNVQTLTLHKDKKTTHRRVSAIPQLKCVGGSGCRYYEVDVMRCGNAGSDYDENSIQWTCRANLPDEFKLGSTDVRCEGYSSPRDPYILKGSCGVEYNLLLTDKGLHKYGHQPATYDISASGAAGKLFSLVFWTLFFSVVFVMIRSAWRNMGAASGRRNSPRPPREGWSGWFGGGGGGPGGPDDPPPPYSPFPPRKSPSTGNWGARNQGQGFRPGFWSGVMGGAAAGYLAGNRRTRTNEPVVNGNREQGRSFYQRPSDDSGEGSSSSSNYHQSTGFGGTSLR